MWLCMVSPGPCLLLNDPVLAVPADIDMMASFPSRFLLAVVIRGISHLMGFLGGSDSKEFACNAGDLCSILRLGGPSGVGSGKPLQYPCLENSTDKSLVGCGPWGHKESDMTRQATLSLSHLLVVVVFADAVCVGWR